MYPFLFRIGNFGVPTYGLFAVLAFFASALVIRTYARKEGIHVGRMVDAVTLICAVGLVGSRVLGVIVSWREIAADPTQIWKVASTIGVYLGSFLTGIPFAIWLFHRMSIRVAVGLDILALVGAISQAVGRWGCFFSGCCYGRPTRLPWGVTFPEIARRLHAGLPSVPVHPTQIYMSLDAFAMLGVLAYVYRRKRFDGQVGMTYLILYGVERFFIEMLRGDAERGFVLGRLLSTSQALSFVIVLGGVIGTYLLARHHRVSGEPDWAPGSLPRGPAHGSPTASAGKMARSSRAAARG